jgi:hypothetical protein
VLAPHRTLALLLPLLFVAFLLSPRPARSGAAAAASAAGDAAAAPDAAREAAQALGSSSRRRRRGRGARRERVILRIKFIENKKQKPEIMFLFIPLE